jgi:uncharacterized RDD family membrane protein YckC
VRDVYTIHTPENVTFEFELAGVGARAVAWAIDVLIMAILIFIAACVFSMATAFLGGFAMALLFIAVFLVQWWYTALLEWWLGGQTLGKKAVGLRTLQARGVRITFMQSVVRNLVRVVDLLPAIYCRPRWCRPPSATTRLSTTRAWHTPRGASRRPSATPWSRSGSGARSCRCTSGTGSSRR